MYTFDILLAKSRIDLSFSGEMKQNPAALFAELSSAVGTVGSRNGTWDLLVDYSDTHVLTQERARHTADKFEWCLENGIRKVACVMNTLTQRMQIQRVTKRHEKIGFFECRHSAEEWLRQ